MHLSIIGSPGCGKTTLFRAFTGTTGAGTAGSSNVAIIEVPDDRLDRLSGIFHPRKTVYARIEVCDMPSIRQGDMKSGAVPANVVHQLRSSDAYLLVLKLFERDAPIDPVTDFHTLASEFIISDMVQIESRLERIKKHTGKKDHTVLEQERGILERCLAHLELGLSLSTLRLAETDERSLKGFQFLSQKPLMVVLNCSEEQMARAGEITGEMSRKLPEAITVMAACARLEAELSAMEPKERPAFMEEYGVAESLRGRLIGLAYRRLGLISFFTVGEDECRAWPIREGMNAGEAAGMIHTDLSERFIRAETVAHADFVRYGDFAACKKAGVWRLEGKQYVVQNGDILTIRAGS